MNSPSPRAGSLSTEEQTGDQSWAWSVVALLVGLAATSRQSLWIDEALTAAKASAPDLHHWWLAMRAEKSLDLQMPLYMLYIWSWAKCLGTSEWALRAANIPWFVAGFTAMVRVIPGPRKIALAVVVLFSPMAWYYLDEARPYALQFGASLVIFSALYRLDRNRNLTRRQERIWTTAFFLAIVSLAGSSLPGMIWAVSACFCALVILSWKRVLALLQSHLFATILTVAALAALTVYYGWTFQAGARASGVGQTTAKNLVYAGYELFGFDGLGPGRLELRFGGPAVFRHYALGLVCYAILVLDLTYLGIQKTFSMLPRRTLTGLGLALALPVLAILGAGYALHFRVVGSHFIALLPVVLLILSFGLRIRVAANNWISRSLVSAFLLLSLYSCLSLHLGRRHQKDDYRNASNYAILAAEQGKVVWWNAGREGAEYYHVPLTNHPTQGAPVIPVLNPSAQTLAALPRPEVVIVSKPDVYDGSGAVADYLKKGRYDPQWDTKLRAFILWFAPTNQPSLPKTPPAADSRN
jgi:hypothetical protein